MLWYDLSMSQYEKHVFVCTSGPYCWFDGDTEEILKNFQRQVSKADLKDQIRINRSGCLNHCGHGPMMVVYPDNVWYNGVQSEDVGEIFQSHLLENDPVQRLCFQMPPGNNKQTEKYPSQVHRFKQIEKTLDEQRRAERQAILETLATESDC